MIFSRCISETSAYKDPVKNQHVKRIYDKIIIGIFVVILGILWYSTRYQIKPERHRIAIYDIFGKRAKIDGIRTNFKTYRVVQSYILEYQKRFNHYHFSIVPMMPEFKERKILGIFKIHR